MGSFAAAPLGRRIAAAALLASALAAPAAAAPLAPPVNTSPPTLVGRPIVGDTMGAATGTWSAEPPVEFDYQWQRCQRAELVCHDIRGATDDTYTVVRADVGSRLRCVIRATNVEGASHEATAPSAVVTPTPVVAAVLSVSSAPKGAVRLKSGETSIPASSVVPPLELRILRIVPPDHVRARVPFRVRVRVGDNRKHVVRGAIVRVSAPFVQPRTAVSRRDGWATVTLRARRVPSGGIRLAVSAKAPQASATG